MIASDELELGPLDPPLSSSRLGKIDDSLARGDGFWVREANAQSKFKSLSENLRDCLWLCSCQLLARRLVCPELTLAQHKHIVQPLHHHWAAGDWRWPF